MHRALNHNIPCTGTLHYRKMKKAGTPVTASRPRDVQIIFVRYFQNCTGIGIAIGIGIDPENRAFSIPIGITTDDQILHKSPLPPFVISYCGNPPRRFPEKSPQNGSHPADDTRNGRLDRNHPGVINNIPGKCCCIVKNMFRIGEAARDPGPGNTVHTGRVPVRDITR